jgi:hypothetical protein
MRLMATLRRGAARLGRFAARFWLAVRFWLALNYSWHMAWIKAERN